MAAPLSRNVTLPVGVAALPAMVTVNVTLTPAETVYDDESRPRLVTAEPVVPGGVGTGVGVGAGVGVPGVGVGAGAGVGAEPAARPNFIAAEPASCAPTSGPAPVCASLKLGMRTAASKPGVPAASW